MTVRPFEVSDPGSLGWELDPDTGRWVWVGDGSQGGGTGGIPEAPVDGGQYGRQDASWTKIVAGGEGGTDSPWVLEENDSGKFVHLADENLSGTYPVIFDIADGSGAWNSLSITQIDGVNLYGEYAWANDMECETLELGPNAYSSRTAVAKGEKRALKSSTRELDWAEVPLVVHGKIQANDVVDADGNSILGQGGGGGDYTGADAVKLTGDQSVAGHKTWTGVATFGDTVIMRGTLNGDDTANFQNAVTAGSFVKSGGTSSQYLMADGSVSTGSTGGDSGFSGDYNDLTNKPTIPTNNNQLTNGAGYITNSALSSYATTSWVGSNYQPKGSYLTASSLNGYATQTWCAQNFVSSSTISGYYTKTEADAKFELKGAGGGASTDTLADVTNRGATTSKSCYAANWHCSKDGYTLGGDGTGSSARIVVLNGMAFTNSSGAATLNVSEQGVASATDFTASSDRNLKDHIETAPTGVVDKLRGVTFQWKEDGRESSGVIAQEVQDAGLGHLVDENEKGLTVNYNGLVAYLIEEIKDLKAQVEELKRD